MTYRTLSDRLVTTWGIILIICALITAVLGFFALAGHSSIVIFNRAIYSMLSVAGLSLAILLSLAFMAWHRTGQRPHLFIGRPFVIPMVIALIITLVTIIIAFISDAQGKAIICSAGFCQYTNHGLFAISATKYLKLEAPGAFFLAAWMVDVALIFLAMGSHNIHFVASQHTARKQ